MRWIGLTGGIATGKSTVSRLLRARGFSVVDADQLARDVVRAGTDGYREVIQAFGPDAVAPDGELNRKAIGDVVFKDRGRLATLENIIHPRVRALALQKKTELEEKGESVAFYDVPLLFEKGMKPLFDFVTVVACSPEQQFARLVGRDGVTPEEARRRIESQLPIAEKIANADFVIDNDADLAQLEKNVNDFIQKILPPGHQANT